MTSDVNGHPLRACRKEVVFSSGSGGSSGRQHTVRHRRIVLTIERAIQRSVLNTSVRYKRRVREIGRTGGRGHPVLEEEGDALLEHRVVRLVLRWRAQFVDLSCEKPAY